MNTVERCSLNCLDDTPMKNDNRGTFWLAITGNTSLVGQRLISEMQRFVGMRFWASSNNQSLTQAWNPQQRFNNLL
jgi:hypothetical protein